jgi:MscS family membrane protein
LREGYKSLLYWQWLALPLLFVVAVIFARALSVPAIALLRFASRWWRSKVWHGVLERARGPASLALSLPLVLLVLPRLSLYLAGEAFVLRVVKALAFTALFWLLMRAVLVIGAIASEDPASLGKAARVSLARLGERAARALLAVIGIVVVLSELGYSVTNIITGLGLGGVALALAAQKTVEHLFGSVSILADQPFRVGDYIKVDGIEGSVEHIGFRSTRIRTLDRTLVILPNGKLADMRIENVSHRDRFRFALRLPLDALTASSQALLLTEKIRALLAAREDVSPDDLSVHVKTVSELALELEVSAYVLVSSAARFFEIREELVLGIHQTMQDLRIALPHPALEIKTAAAAAPTAEAKG